MRSLHNTQQTLVLTSEVGPGTATEQQQPTFTDHTDQYSVFCLPPVQMSDAIKQDIKLFGDSSDLSLIGNRLKAPPLPAGECDHGTNVETTGASIVYSSQWVRPPCTPLHPAAPCPLLHQLPTF